MNLALSDEKVGGTHYVFLYHKIKKMCKKLQKGIIV